MLLEGRDDDERRVQGKRDLTLRLDHPDLILLHGRCFTFTIIQHSVLSRTNSVFYSIDVNQHVSL